MLHSLGAEDCIQLSFCRVVTSGTLSQSGVYFFIFHTEQPTDATTFPDVSNRASVLSIVSSWVFFLCNTDLVAEILPLYCKLLHFGHYDFMKLPSRLIL